MLWFGKMANRKYANSAVRELRIKKDFEEDGWYAIRASGSHGIADVVTLRPAKGCTNPAHFEAKFIQIKTSQNIREKKVKMLALESACGYINVEYHYYPVKNKKFFEAQRKRKAKVTPQRKR